MKKSISLIVFFLCLIILNSCQSGINKKELKKVIDSNKVTSNKIFDTNQKTYLNILKVYSKLDLPKQSPNIDTQRFCYKYFCDTSICNTFKNNRTNFGNLYFLKAKIIQNITDEHSTILSIGNQKLWSCKLTDRLKEGDSILIEKFSLHDIYPNESAYGFPCIIYCYFSKKRY